MARSFTSAALIARILKARGTGRVFALCGGHIMPIWMALDDEGIEIVGVRDERSAVMMAHAHAAVTGGFGVALVTAGPGVTNAMTGIANAHVSRMPVLVLSGVPPAPQENRGALQDMSHTALVAPITRHARTVRHVNAVARELDAAIAAALGHFGEPGPAFVDFPVDLQRDTVPPALCCGEHIAGVERPRTRPLDHDIDKAARMIAAAARPLVISGRGANGAAEQLAGFLTASGAAYLDTGETRGIVPDDHPTHVGALRARAMSEADLVVTVGRKLDFQLAYGSPAIFGAARFLRISDQPQELFDNRLGDAVLAGDPGETLTALTARLTTAATPPRDWVATLHAGHMARIQRLASALGSAPDDENGHMHPNRLLGALRERLDPDAVVIADGGDFLSFARVALPCRTYLDPGPLGCIGVATPFALGAAMAAPGRQVVAVTGDGAFGFTAMELDTIARHPVPLMIVVGNNGSWGIEVRDQMQRFGKEVATRLQFADHAAMARAFGLKAWRVETGDMLSPALDAAFAAMSLGQPVLLDVIVSDKAASSDSKSGLAWVPDHQALQAWDKAERNWLGY
ncbi:thiamine pyrophosphate-binding protein [Paracoccus sp. (in: a-proteobacteria)]|uniref:thiamine pyrophosphate-binding protein n=1 Tax=Paracoccus sp. TaxID=267 RepID=UPI003A8AA8F0